MNTAPRTLVFEGRLRVATDGLAFEVEGQGGSLAVDVASLGEARTIFRRLPGARPCRDAIASLSRRLAWAGLTLKVRAVGRAVATMGSGSEPGFLSRMLRPGPTRLHFLSLLALRRA